MSKGDFTPGKTVVVRFNTHKADGTPITLAGTPAISAYKNSTTESNAGVTLTVDYDSRTGLHHVSIDTSADGTFYAAGNDFDLVLTAGTVDSISVVGTVVGGFSLSNRSALRPSTADRTIVVDAAGLADANTVKIGPSGSGTAQTAKDLGAINVTNLNTLSGHDPGATLGTSTLTQAQVTGGAYALNSSSFSFNTAFDFTTTQKTSLNSATPSVTVSDKTGFSLTQTFPSNFSSLSITSAGLVSTTSNVKKNQALSSFMFLMTDSTNHAPATGLTVTVTRSIDGGAFSSGTLGSVTEVSAGMYKVDLGAGDLNGNVIVLKAAATGADVTLERIVTTP